MSTGTTLGSEPNGHPTVLSTLRAPWVNSRGLITDSIPAPTSGHGVPRNVSVLRVLHSIGDEATSSVLPTPGPSQAGIVSP